MNPMKTLLSVILVSLLLLSLPLKQLQAAPLNLYLGAVPVADQSQAERSRAMPLALKQVLQKLTGLRDFVDFPALEPALEDARSMAVTFYYGNREFTLPDGEHGEELRVLVDFSRPDVDRLLQSLQLPIWKPERKPLAIWLVIDDGFSRSIMPIEFEYAWDRMSEVAETRGMPITRPQPDDAGKYAVDPQLLWGGYTEELDEFGPVDALLIAARREGPEWNVRMNLDYMGKMWSWRNQDTEIENALVDGLQQAIDEISVVNSITAADQGHWNFEITVTGLLTGADYTRCLSYLQAVSMIDRVRVSEAGPGWVHFILNLNALPDHLLQTLAADRIVAASPTAGEYVLQPKP